jgi:hypothetical protein
VNPPNTAHARTRGHAQARSRAGRHYQVPFCRCFACLHMYMAHLHARNSAPEMTPFSSRSTILSCSNCSHFVETFALLFTRRRGTQAEHCMANKDALWSHRPAPRCLKAFAIGQYNSAASSSNVPLVEVRAVYCRRDCYMCSLCSLPSVAPSFSGTISPPSICKSHAAEVQASDLMLRIPDVPEFWNQF